MTTVASGAGESRWLLVACGDQLRWFDSNGTEQVGKVRSRPLGDPAVRDLSALYLSSCELLRQIWNAVPSVWEDGRTVVRSPVDRRGCTPLTSVSAEPVTR